MSSPTSDTTLSIFRSATRFFSGTMLSRISGMVRDICMAYAFGTHSAIAALLVAFRFAHLLRRLLGEGAMQTALIPHFEELRKENPQRAGFFFRDLTFSLTGLLLLIIAGIMASLGGILFWNVLDEANQEITWLTFLMMPSLLFICLFGINASLMQCEKSYFSPSAAPVLFNLFWIIGIISCSTLPQTQAMSILSIFIVAACAAQWAITLPQTLSILNGFGVKSLFQGARYFSKDVVRLGKPLALGIIGVAAAQINNAMDAVFARWADAEGPAYLWYAIRLQQLPLGLFGVALSGALLPPLARAVKAGDKTLARCFLDFATRRTLALMLPLTAALFIFGEGSISLIYRHGGFTNTSVFGTTQCLWGYTFGLIPMALVLILAPAFYAKGDYKTPSKAAMGSVVVNIGLNTLLVAFLDMGAASIAFATSVSSWFNLFWLTKAFQKDQDRESVISRALVLSTSKIVLAVSLAVTAVILTDLTLWENYPALEILRGTVPESTISFMKQLMRLTLDGAIFGIVLAGAAVATKATDLTQFLGKPNAEV
ncbi:MAG: murein biosynthesis integral membrane protein MurJ [Parachlamydiaceae bacterium]